MPTKPMIIITHVEGSGTALTFELNSTANARGGPCVRNREIKNIRPSSASKTKGMQLTKVRIGAITTKSQNTDGDAVGRYYAAIVCSPEAADYRRSGRPERRLEGNRL